MESLNFEKLDPKAKERVKEWLAGPYDEKTKQEIQDLLKKNPQTLSDAFFKNLSFGTGGMRGIMGVGTNRLNKYTIQMATQGLANYICQNGPINKSSVLIGYDSRNNSRFFAEVAAKVLSGNKIKVFLYDKLRPVPFVSFGVRHLGCKAGIMITASHNPPEYNGYKVYWDDGAQVLPPHDVAIVEEVNKIQDPTKVKIEEKIDNPLIQIVGDELVPVYLNMIRKLQSSPDENKREGSDLKIIYTNLHGTGITLVPAALSDWGFSNVHLVEKQKAPDGNFPNAPIPNPEIKETLKLGTDQMMQENADILVATDPDADRVGVVARHKDEAIIFTGNQIACICLYHICAALSSRGNLPKKAAFVKSIVTTELFRAIAEDFKTTCFDVLTGFKYIGEKIRSWEKDKDPYEFIFGAEESYGYLLGTHARDKDAIVSTCLIAEVALNAKKNNKTLVDLLNEIYSKYGVYREQLTSIKFEESQKGMEIMKQIMENLRGSFPKKIGSLQVKKVQDYQTSQTLDVESGKITPIELPKSNVLQFWLEDESKVVIRPSGTEPKIKIYVGGIERKFSSIEQGIKDCDQRLNTLTVETKQLLKM